MVRAPSLGILPFVIWLIVVACDGTAGAPAPGPAPSATAQAPAAAPSPAPTPAPLPPLPGIVVERVAGGLQRPTFVTGAGDGSGRLFVLEKRGTIRIVRDGAVLPEPFLDIRSRVTSSGNEQGLLGLAFHPRFAENGRFFVYYTAADGGANTLAEFRVSSTDPDRADPASARVLLAIPDRYSNHNGGMLAFGPDGYLYIALGDGGGAGDPLRAGQDLANPLGAILRIDVDAPPASGLAYAIPPDNPFLGREGARPEIWAYGLRNPWRFSFDRQTGDLWIADVGQNAREEVNFQPAGSPGGQNYGWSIMEGTNCYRPASGCDRTGLTLPVFEYTHSDGCSITGGYVYRGAAFPALRGAYLAADYCTGAAWAIRRQGETFRADRLPDFPTGISSFGEDDAGELYIVRDQPGTLERLVVR
ncbi:PQQ-dependent sugar dehydrogenase [Tepidiforma thermophila]|uniref:Glucose/arabinose dehydrogenase n=1 Tax=Tepidiforma thermophila (strain KCTC 52669 / CGMCC 1.13589 / G233) TaxID=2761530 RepID=A0A2A9HCE9_TEPT2|nr:PQQ-dependent sugar dehydrogenase [Tepidiforma thermophila]PFG73644.1 glucose/arabinose dehydrogenase [Tepidiforma thermophila]